MLNFRDLILNYSVEQLDSLPGEFIISFDDGSGVSVSKNPTILSCVFLKLLVQKYPLVKLTFRHHSQSITAVGGSYTNETHKKLLNNFFMDVIDNYKLTTPELMEPLLEVVNDANTYAFNELGSLTVANLQSIDILDVVNIINHPKMIDIYNDLYPTVPSIDKAYKRAEEFLMSSDMDGNGVAQIYRAKAVNSAQVMQVIVCRGFCLDITNEIIPKPVLSSFGIGIKNLADSLAESRSASLALSNATRPLELVEYTSRTIQLNASVLMNIHYEDCGSTHYLDWIVKESDIKNMLGIYYLDEVTNTLKVITEDSLDLVGKSIKIRSPVAGCNHPDPNGVCSVCAGALSLNKPVHSNAGIYFASLFFMEMSQKVLSTKHLLATAKTEKLVISGRHNDYICVNSSGNGYTFNKGIENLDPVLIFEVAEAESLHDILITDDVNDLELTRVSNLSAIGIKIDGNVYEIPLQVANSKAVLSYPMLSFIKEKGYKVEGKLYKVDLSNWDFDETFSVVPSISYSMLTHAMQISSLLEGKVKDSKERALTKPGKLLLEIFELTNSKLSVNLTTLQLLLYTVMITSETDFNLPKGGNGILGVVDVNIPKRSLGTAMAYERIYDLITDPDSHNLPGSYKKPQSPFDIYL